MDSLPGLPVSDNARLKMQHAAVQFVADELNCRILHFKGPLVAVQFPAEAPRASSDVDIMVHPADAAKLKLGLHAAGWSVHEESVDEEWHHASVFRHEVWGCSLDVHLRYPGIRAREVEAFDVLNARGYREVFGGFGCSVPGRVEHAALLLLHAARVGAEARHVGDIDLVQKALTPVEREQLLLLAKGLRCMPALASVWPEAQTQVSPSLESWIWSSSRLLPAISVWTERWLYAQTARERMNVVRGVFGMSPSQDEGFSHRMRRGTRQLRAWVWGYLRARRGRSGAAR